MKKNRKKFLFGNRKILLTLLVACISWSAFAQTLTVNGTVTDPYGEGVIGASVLEKGTTNGLITDFDGNFTMTVSEGATLVISYVGFVTQEIRATSTMKITLQEDSELLDEVVVIGYGSVKRKDVTTAISSVSTKDLDQRPIVSAAQAIQGKAAGISVIQPSGEPGSSLSVRVRGTTSINGSNDPLYVVDGVPMTDIKFLSANDIADMQILKDASSAAIYGSRAANGVIMITTKQGAAGIAKVSFNAHAGITKVANSVKSLNVAQYKELMDEIGMVKLPDGLTDQTDWFKETYRTGVTQNYQASVSNGNDKMKYFISGGYTSEDGVIKVAYYKRYNFRANLDNQIRPWLNVGANISYSDYSSNGIISGQGANRAGVILSVVNAPTYAPIWDPDNPDQYYNNFYGVNVTHPLENMARSENNKNKANRLLATGKVQIDFFKGLKLNSSLTLDRDAQHETTFLDPVKTTYGRDLYGTASDRRSLSSVIVQDNVLTYNKSVGKHSIEAMAGSSYTRSSWSQSYISGSHFMSDDIKTLNAANKISWSETRTNAAQWAIMSYFGRLAYNYDSKYLVTANVRADGSSKLHPDHRWGYFPSVSAAWRISSEAFMEDVNWISDLKLRGGWGQTGNQSGLGDYAYLQMYKINRVQWWEEGNENAVPTLSVTNLRTKDLTWETTTQSNIGLDVSLLDSRLNIYMDYYYKKTTNMLMKVGIPPGASVADEIRRNEGEMTNKGFELTINSQNLRGKFEWTTDFNISFNRNKLTKLALKQVYYNAKTSDTVGEYAVRNVVGRSLGGFYGYISDGVNPETGELMYRDLNDDGIISTSDRTYIGDPNPDFTFGLTNTFNWKGFSLNVLLQGSYGNDIFNASRMETEGMYDGKNQSTKVLNRWKIPGQITKVPKANFDMKNSTYFIEDGSYLRVKDISLSYNVRSQQLRKWGITRLQPYFTATNLLTWTKYSGMDPEVNQWGGDGDVQGIDWGTYPHSKSFIFGLNIEF